MSDDRQNFENKPQSLREYLESFNGSNGELKLNFKKGFITISKADVNIKNDTISFRTFGINISLAFNQIEYKFIK